MISRYFHTSTRLGMKNYYSILGVARGSTTKEIKEAYYEKAKLYHPDANKANAKVAEDKFRDVSEAYEVLMDNDKRRAYDSTTRQTAYDVYGHPMNRDASYMRSPQRTAESVSMNHIHHVYRTLNKNEEQEQAKFRPFEDHNFPGTEFNRFEYTRFWDRVASKWVYVKRKDANLYHKQMREKSRILNLCIAVLVFGSATFITCYKYFLYSFKPKPNTMAEKYDKDNRMYIWESRGR